MAPKNPILITGSEGLIGRQLIALLNQTDVPVIKLDKRLPASFPGAIDILDKVKLYTLIKSCSGIIHLAGVSRVVWGEQNPELCWDTNVAGTENILDIASQQKNGPWIIYASSREVYGQQSDLPITETAKLQPLNIYAKSKVAAEDLINQYREKGLKTAIIRFSSVYGSCHDYPDRVIPAFCLNALKEEPLCIEGLENQLDFTHINDVVLGIVEVIKKLNMGEHHLPTFHFTTGMGTTLIQVANLLEKIVHKKINYYEASSRTYDVHRFYADAPLAKKYLNWTPKISLEDGLKDLLSQYQHHLKVED